MTEISDIQFQIGRWLIFPLQSNADLAVTPSDSPNVWTARMRSSNIRSSFMGSGIYSIDIRQHIERWRMHLECETRSFLWIGIVSGRQCTTICFSSTEIGWICVVELGSGLCAIVDRFVLELSWFVQLTFLKTDFLFNTSSCVSGVLYSIIFCGILLRSPQVSQQQRKSALNSAVGNSFTVLPILVYQVC